MYIKHFALFIVHLMTPKYIRIRPNQYKILTASILGVTEKLALSSLSVNLTVRAKGRPLSFTRHRV